MFECLGVQDVVAKSIGTSNPHNMIKAAFEALESMMSPRAVAARRGLKVADIIGRRDVQDSVGGGDEVAAIAPGPLREEDMVSYAVVRNFLDSKVGHSSVVLAGDPTFCAGVAELCLSDRGWRIFWVRHLEEWPPWL